MDEMAGEAEERRISMLVLSRRVHETLLIGGHIKVTVLGIKGGQVRLGIAAPTDVPIRRENGLYRSRTIAPALERHEK